MSDLTDPLERLRAVNPVPGGVATLTRPDPVLFERIVSGVPFDVRRAAPPRRARRRLVPAPPVVGLVGGGVAYALSRGQVTKPQKVACYKEADVESDTESAVVDRRGPVAACAELWRDGVFGPDVEVPAALAECVLDSGVAGVFPTRPSEDVCAVLNLPPVTLAPGPVPVPGAPTTGPPATAAPADDVNARVLALRDAVFGQFVGIACVEPRAAADIVRRELEQAGLRDWTIRGGEGLAGDGFSPERPCATLSLRPETREVVLVPSPRR